MSCTCRIVSVAGSIAVSRLSTRLVAQSVRPSGAAVTVCAPRPTKIVRSTARVSGLSTAKWSAPMIPTISRPPSPGTSCHRMPAGSGPTGARHSTSPVPRAIAATVPLPCSVA